MLYFSDPNQVLFVPKSHQTLTTAVADEEAVKWIIFETWLTVLEHTILVERGVRSKNGTLQKQGKAKHLILSFSL